VIDERQAADRLVAVCPGFAPYWLEYLDSTERVPTGEFNDISALAAWVIDRMAIGNFDCFAELFQEAENLLATGTTEVRDLVVIGLLEDIQYGTIDRRVDPDIALRFLGPESRKEWFFLVRHLHPDWPGQTREDG
jgi:hypothetical protein